MNAFLRTSLASAFISLFVFATSAHALSISTTLTPFTGDPVIVHLTLDDMGDSGDIRFTLNSVPDSDITGFYFNISDNTLLSGLSVTNANFSPITTDFSGNVTAVGGAYNNMLGGGSPAPFDVGIAIGTQGAAPGDFFPNPAFTLTHNSVNLTLDMFDGQWAGARVQSIGGSDGPSAKLSGIIPEPLTAMLTVMSAAAVSMAVGRRRAGREIA